MERTRADEPPASTGSCGGGSTPCAVEGKAKRRRRRWERPYSSGCVAFMTVVVLLLVCAGLNALMERKGAFMVRHTSRARDSSSGLDGERDERGKLWLLDMDDADAAQRLQWLRTVRSNRGEYAHDPQRPQVQRVAFLKTHKTGSSTVNGIFHRFAARAGLPRCKTEHEHEHCAFHIDHVSHGRLRTTRLFNTTGLLRHYDHIMGTAPRRVVTLLREPVQTFVSRFFYYVEPSQRARRPAAAAHNETGAEAARTSLAMLRRFVQRTEASKEKQTSVPYSGLTAEFGVETAEQLQQFITSTPGLASFDDVLLTEKLDEGLVMLRHELNWDLADLMYLPVRTSSVANREMGVSYRWDGLALRRTPAMTTLSTGLHESIAAATQLDRSLYMRAAATHDARAHLFDRRHGAGALLRQVASLRALNSRLQAACSAPMRGAAEAVRALATACEWYTRPCTLQTASCLRDAATHCREAYCTGKPACGARCPHTDWTSADANLPLPDALR